MRLMDPSQQDSHTVVRMNSSIGRKVATRWHAHHPIHYNTGRYTNDPVIILNLNHEILGITITVIRASSGCIMSWRKGAEYLYGHDV